MIRDFAAALAGAMLLSMLVFAGAARSASAQSPANGSNSPAQGSTSAPADKSPGTKESDKPAQTTPEKHSENGSASAAAAPQAKKPRVITNDDLKADRARRGEGFASAGNGGPGSVGSGDCDDTCAQQARGLAGFGPDQDGEWQFALAAARRSLSADAAWPGAYITLVRAVNQYCTFQQQLQTTAVPSGNDYNSRVERAKTQKYAEDMNRVLGQNVTNANAQIERMAQQAEESEPARAAIMRVLAQRVNDTCDP